MHFTGSVVANFLQQAEVLLREEVERLAPCPCVIHVETAEAETESSVIRLTTSLKKNQLS